MPRKDPVTGVPVLTDGEFWDRIATSEGKGQTGPEVMADFYEDMERGRVEETKRLHDPEAALKTLVEYVETENRYRKECRQYPLCAMPVRITKVISADYDFDPHGQRIEIVAEGITKGKRKGTVTLKTWETRGSYFEPPDGETEITWEYQK